jgi:hypothetical protein
MSYLIRLAQLAISGTLAGATRLRLQRCFTAATLCITLTVVLVLLERVLGLLGLLERVQERRALLAPAVICCLRPYLAVLCLGLAQRAARAARKQMLLIVRLICNFNNLENRLCYKSHFVKLAFVLCHYLRHSAT